MSGPAAALPEFPPFIRELVDTLSVHSQFVLHGNIRDEFLAPGPTGSEHGVRPARLAPVLWQALLRNGFDAIVVYDPVDGLAAYPTKDAAVTRAAVAALGPRVLGRNPSLTRLRRHLAKVVGVPEPPDIERDDAHQQHSDEAHAGGAVQAAEPVAPAGPRPRVAFLIDYAARITRERGHLDIDERNFFVFCQKLAMTARPQPGPSQRPAPIYNPVIWLVENESDLPAWLSAGVERIRTIGVPTPDLGQRQVAARIFGKRLVGVDLDGRDPRVLRFAERTEGLTLQAMHEIVNLALDRRMRFEDVADAVRIYKLGIEDNPWLRESVRARIREGEQWIRDEVIGQEQAVVKTLDILKRAAMNLSGAQATSSAHRPKGVLFFAGPTGVGKTELAKQVARVVFGDPEAFLRFDMSEFAQEHAAERLAGAPPGFVGFEAGGELTGAVRRQPFRVILFDEIEKAHGLVLDKFLQILEDGRLTDGQGITTYFSETVLVFTSNLGIIATERRTNPDGTISEHRRQVVQPNTPYPEMEAEVRRRIREHFVLNLGRPELLNRFGENIVIFDFIKEHAGEKIFEKQLRNIKERLLAEHGHLLVIDEAARADLLALCTKDLMKSGDAESLGARGIGNQLESRLINPLSRYLFDNDVPSGATVTIERFLIDNGVAHVRVRAERR